MSQLTAVDSTVFPVVLQPHFEDRLMWINAVCITVPFDERRGGMHSR